MSNLHRFSLPANYRAHLISMFPHLTAANLIRFDDLLASDRLLTDEGKATPALTEWVIRVARVAE